MSKTYSYKELYPNWDADHFMLPGATLVETQTCVSAFEAARKAVTKNGGDCPCCGQHVQVHPRNIYKTMAKVLVWLVGEYNRTHDWVRLKDGPVVRGGDNAKLTYWHLMVRDEEAEGYYKPTQIAIDYVGSIRLAGYPVPEIQKNRPRLSLPRFAYIYNGKVLGYSTERVFIEDCLDHDFDFADIGIEPWTAFGNEPFHFNSPSADKFRAKKKKLKR